MYGISSYIQYFITPQSTICTPLMYIVSYPQRKLKKRWFRRHDMCVLACIQIKVRLLQHDVVV